MYMQVEAQILSQVCSMATMPVSACNFVYEQAIVLCAGKQQVVKNSRVLKKQAVEFIRNRKNHMKVWDRQRSACAFHPCFTLRILAPGQ